jgi:nucleoside-diphosphate-sugar epimerase
VKSLLDASNSFSVAVTGANGFIGTHLINALTKQGIEVLALGRMSPNQLPEGARWIEWSAEWNWPVRQLKNVQSIYHLAASTSAYDARNAPQATMRTNALSVLRLVDQLRHFNYRPKVISVGSVTELKPTLNGFISDASPIQPSTFYDVSKVTQRLILDQCALEGWVNGVSILLPNVYGYWTYTHASHRGFLNSAIRRAINGQELTYFEDAQYIRDFLHVDDVVDALLRASNTSHLSRSSYVIGTGIGIPIRKALDIIADIVKHKTGATIKVSPVSPPSGLYAIERRNTIVSCSPFIRDTGWSPNIGFRDGVAHVIDQYLESELS